jgi:hypothetical protein
MAYIKQITLPDGVTYDLRDQQAWEQLGLQLTKKIAASLPDINTLVADTALLDEALRALWLIGPSTDPETLNEYEEYVLLRFGSEGNYTYSFEKIGSTTVDLSGYSQTGHTHQVTPQTQIADHNFTVQTTLPDIVFEGIQSTISGDVSLDSGDVSISIGNQSAEGTSYTPEVSLGGTTETESSHTHNIKKNERYLERTTIYGVSSNASQENVMAHKTNYSDTTHQNVFKLSSNGQTHSHTIKGLKSADFTGTLQTSNNIAADGTLEDVVSGNEGNAVFHSASVSDGVLSFGLKQLSKNVSAVTGIGTLGLNAVQLDSTNDDTFEVYHTTDISRFTITDWDLEEKQLNVPTVNATGTKVATGKFTDNSTYDGENNASVVANVLSGSASNPSSGTTSTVATDGGTAHSHSLNSGSNGNATAQGTTVKFSGSLDEGTGTITNGSCTPQANVYYDGNVNTVTSDNVTLVHSVYNPTVITSPDDDPSSHVYDWYGITYDESVANSAKTRIGNDTYHKTLPIQSLMRRCLLNEDGTVNYYLDPNNSSYKADGSASDLNGGDGDVMVEVPRHWRLVTKENGVVTAMISPFKQEGWKEVKRYFVGASLSQKYRTKLVCRQSSGSTTPFIGIAPSQALTYVRNKGVVDDEQQSYYYKWNLMPYELYIDLYWLYVIEYANTNVQLAFNATLNSGYRQGGLGDGTTNFSNPTGPAFSMIWETRQLGNNSGSVAIDNTNATGGVTHVPSYRGIEGLFGVNTFVDGIVCYNGHIYRCDDPSQYVQNSGDISSYTAYTHYATAPTMATSNGYISGLYIGDDGDIMPTAVSGSSSTYYCDRIDIGSTQSVQRICVGGLLNDGQAAGIGRIYTEDMSSPDYGALAYRICFWDF